MYYNNLFYFYEYIAIYFIFTIGVMGGYNLTLSRCWWMLCWLYLWTHLSEHCGFV